MLAMGPRDLNSAPYSPGCCSGHSITSFQSSELTELPVVENSQLFAQRTVRPLGIASLFFTWDSSWIEEQKFRDNNMVICDTMNVEYNLFDMH